MSSNRFTIIVKYLFLIVCTVLAANFINLTATVNAQSATAIDFEKPVKGEITNSQFATNYTFSGKANDVIVINMHVDYSDSGADLTSQLILLDGKNNKLADTSDQPYSMVNLAVQLAADGNYTITATRDKGKNGTSKGKFVLTLHKAALLTADTPVKDKTTSSADKFYTYTSGSAFMLNYQKTAGDFAPTIAVNLIDNNDLKTVGAMSGTELTSGSITVTPKDKAIYVVKVGQGLLEFSITETTANYSLSISPAK